MTKNLRAAYALALLAIVCLFANATAQAQSVYGSIFGSVTDKTGAVVAGATVTATDEAKGTVVTVITNGAGDYTVSHLTPGTYDLKVEVKGFKGYVSKGIVVQADTAPRVDVALEIAGASAETITVNADTEPQLKTDRADVSTVFDQQQVADLPIGDQNFTNLQLLLPGAQLLGWSHAASENPQASKQIQIDGQAFGGTAFELDGTDNQDPILGIIIINPALDAVTETKITTQNFDAEFGKAVSAVITAQTRSGSNSFHGSGYDFITDNTFLARDPYTQNPDASFPGGHKYRFGASLGGPIWKDKIFFFGNYEGQRQTVGINQTDTLPTPNLLNSCLDPTMGCDFSEYEKQIGILNNDPNSGKIYDNKTLDAKGFPTQFPGNVIPYSRLSAPALALLKYLQPYKLTPGVGTAQAGGTYGLFNNYNQGGSGTFNSDEYTIRGDWTINQKASMFVRFSQFKDTLTGKVMFGDAGGPGFGLGGFGGTSLGNHKSLAIGADYVFNPKLIADLRFGWYNYNINTSKYDQGTSFAQTLGIPGENLGDRFTSGSPIFYIGSTLLGSGLDTNRCNCPLTEDEKQLQFVSNWTWTLGNHAVKFGADLRFADNLRVPSDTNRSGAFHFGAGPTSNPNDKALSSAGGFEMASFVLGDVTSFGRYVSVSTNAKEHQNRPFFYIQDTWRVNNKLQLNLGGRWELYFPESVNAKGNGALMNLDDGYLHVAGYGNNGSNMGWTLDKLKQFEPRIGVTYQLTPKTVIRSGLGRSFDTGVFGSIFGHVVTQNLPVLANQQINSTGGTTSAFDLSVAPPSGPAALAQYGVIPNSGLLPNPGYAINSKSRPNPLRFPTLDAWNFSIQRSITPALSVTAAYVANKGTHTLSSGDGNNTNPNEAAINLPAQYSITGQPVHYDPAVKSGIAADGGTSNTNYLLRFFGGSRPACKDAAYSQPTITDATVSTAGMCGWSNGVSYYGDNQNTNFNALQVTIADRVGKDLNVNANYQWAVAHNYDSSFSTWDKAATYGNAEDVRRQALTGYGSYGLPFGKGKMFGANVNRLTDAVIGGFQISGVMNWSSGLPFSVSYSTCSDSVPGDAPCHPNANGKMSTSLTSFDPVSHSRTFYQAHADSQGNLTGPFSKPGLDTIGNAGRNTYFGPSFFNTDLSINKTITIWEKVSIELRMDAQNAFNHINAGNPGGNIQSPGTITGQAPGPGPRQLEFSGHLKF